ncbi:Reticulocalbin-2 [Sarcoptes scabiei]|nr:Reticulocalbin-2 [Sarcoptes scabiei]
MQHQSSNFKKNHGTSIINNEKIKEIDFHQSQSCHSFKNPPLNNNDRNSKSIANINDDLIENAELIEKLFPKCRPKTKASSTVNVSKNKNDNSRISSIEQHQLDDSYCEIIKDSYVSKSIDLASKNNETKVQSSRIWKFMNISPSSSPPLSSPLERNVKENDLDDHIKCLKIESKNRSEWDNRPMSNKPKFEVKNCSESFNRRIVEGGYGRKSTRDRQSKSDFHSFNASYRLDNLLKDCNQQTNPNLPEIQANFKDENFGISDDYDLNEDDDVLLDRINIGLKRNDPSKDVFLKSNDTNNLSTSVKANYSINGLINLERREKTKESNDYRFENGSNEIITRNHLAIAGGKEIFSSSRSARSKKKYNQQLKESAKNKTIAVKNYVDVVEHLDFTREPDCYESNQPESIDGSDSFDHIGTCQESENKLSQNELSTTREWDTYIENVSDKTDICKNPITSISDSNDLEIKQKKPRARENVDQNNDNNSNSIMNSASIEASNTQSESLTDRNRINKNSLTKLLTKQDGSISMETGNYKNDDFESKANKDENADSICEKFAIDLKNKLNIVSLNSETSNQSLNVKQNVDADCNDDYEIKNEIEISSIESDNDTDLCRYRSSFESSEPIARLIGSVPIAQYEESPKRYGPKPGYPQRITSSNDYSLQNSVMKSQICSSENRSPNSYASISGSFSSTDVQSSSSCPSSNHRNANQDFLEKSELYINDETEHYDPEIETQMNTDERARSIIATSVENLSPKINDGIGMSTRSLPEQLEINDLNRNVEIISAIDMKNIKCNQNHSRCRNSYNEFKSRKSTSDFDSKKSNVITSPNSESKEFKSNHRISLKTNKLDHQKERQILNRKNSSRYSADDCYPRSSCDSMTDIERRRDSNSFVDNHRREKDYATDLIHDHDSKLNIDEMRVRNGVNKNFNDEVSNEENHRYNHVSPELMNGCSFGNHRQSCSRKKKISDYEHKSKSTPLNTMPVLEDGLSSGSPSSDEMCFDDSDENNAETDEQFEDFRDSNTEDYMYQFRNKFNPNGSNSQRTQSENSRQNNNEIADSPDSNDDPYEKTTDHALNDRGIVQSFGSTRDKIEKRTLIKTSSQNYSEMNKDLSIKSLERSKHQELISDDRESGCFEYSSSSSSNYYHSQQFQSLNNPNSEENLKISSSSFKQNNKRKYLDMQNHPYFASQSESDSISLRNKYCPPLNNLHTASHTTQESRSNISHQFNDNSLMKCPTEANDSRLNQKLVNPPSMLPLNSSATESIGASPSQYLSSQNSFHHYFHQHSSTHPSVPFHPNYPTISNSPTLMFPNSSDSLPIPNGTSSSSASSASSASSSSNHQSVPLSSHLNKSTQMNSSSGELQNQEIQTASNLSKINNSNENSNFSNISQAVSEQNSGRNIRHPHDEDQETDRLLGSQRANERPFYDDKSKRSSTSRDVLIEGVLFRARYLGSTQLICDGQPTKATRMMQAEEAVSRIKAPEGESQPSTEVDLFISTEKIMVLNTDLKEIMMDHALRTISYIADIGDLLVLMARRRSQIDDTNDSNVKRIPKMICHVFESEEAQYIAQSIGQAFQVAYMEFLKANGIKDSSFLKEMDYQEVLNSQEIFGDELEMFSKRDKQKEVIVPKHKGEILGIVIVESGWGSMLPTVVIANLAQNSPSARCGQLNIGDQIIAINGISLVGLPLSTCQNYVKNTKNQTAVKFTIVPCPPVVEVKIKRPDTKYQLGFSVQNGVICSLLRGGIAERGGVRVGHRIIEINGQSVVAVPHDRIVNLLATSVGEIHMKTMPTSMFRLLTGQESPSYL